jgi:hypothetical protein
MTYNTIAYLFYLPFTIGITWWVGKDLNRKGAYLLWAAFEDNALVNTINRFLLLGYYLLNIGYAVLSLSLFPRLESSVQLFSVLAFRVGIIMSSLAIIHYINILVIHLFSVQIKKFLHI